MSKLYILLGIKVIIMLYILLVSFNNYLFAEMLQDNTEEIFHKIVIELKEVQINKLQDLYIQLGLEDVTNDSQSVFRRCYVSSLLPFKYLREQLLNSRIVKEVEPDSLYRLNKIPDDPLFNMQWGLHNLGQTKGKEDADVDAPEAWDFHTGSREIVIAVIDTGIDYNHIDLKDNIWINEGEIPKNGIDDDENGYVDDVYGWDFFNWDNDPMDDSYPIYHGTHVSGIIGAIGDNSQGIAGMNWKIKIMPLKSFCKYGYAYLSNILPAIQYAIKMGANVINASWGSIFPSEALKEMIDYAGKNGVIFVAAAGNFRMDLDNPPKIRGRSIGFYPAGYDLPNIISVAASDHNDKLAWFSNYGKTSVDLTAPGVNIISTKFGNEYRYLSGTSMAAPHTTGVVGLMLSQNLTINQRDIIETILDRVDPLPEFKEKVKSGGRLNAANCMGYFPRLSVPDYIMKFIYYYLVETN
ncbi:MAG: S8 family peptidase [bacterium]